MSTKQVLIEKIVKGIFSSCRLLTLVNFGASALAEKLGLSNLMMQKSGDAMGQIY